MIKNNQLTKDDKLVRIDRLSLISHNIDTYSEDFSFVPML